MKNGDPIDASLIRYELWEEEGSLSFFPETHASFRAMLGPNARLVWSCTARTWEEAQTKKHEHLGWGPYVPSSV